MKFGQGFIAVKGSGFKGREGCIADRSSSPKLFGSSSSELQWPHGGASTKGFAGGDFSGLLWALGFHHYWQAQQAKELYLLLENVFEEMKVDWASVREDEVRVSAYDCTFLFVSMIISGCPSHSAYREQPLLRNGVRS